MLRSEGKYQNFVRVEQRCFCHFVSVKHAVGTCTGWDNPSHPGTQEPGRDRTKLGYDIVRFEGKKPGLGYNEDIADPGRDGTIKSRSGTG